MADSRAATAADLLARMFHEAYEELAPSHGWETQERSRKDWDDVPAENRSLMIATAQRLIENGVILIPDDIDGPLGITEDGRVVRLEDGGHTTRHGNFIPPDRGYLVGPLYRFPNNES